MQEEKRRNSQYFHEKYYGYSFSIEGQNSFVFLHVQRGKAVA